MLLKTLLIRASSAIVAGLIVLLLFHFFQERGLQALCVFVVLAGTREFSRLVFKPSALTFIFAAFVALVFALSVYSLESAGLFLTLATVLYCCFAIFFGKSFESLESIIFSVGKATLGFVYLGLIPAFAIRLIELPLGFHWFISMLVIVFAGDTFAYLTGLTMGKNKLMPLISPKKTIEGSLGGLVGSVASALLLSAWLVPQAPLWFYGLMGAFVGVVAQLGDLFESLLKRVANRKDSGTLMPGHGGVLDRLDGILFAIPMVFLFALLAQKYFS